MICHARIIGADEEGYGNLIDVSGCIEMREPACFELFKETNALWEGHILIETIAKFALIDTLIQSD